MKNGKFQYAVIGCGSISSAHLSSVCANSDIMDLYACCDLIEERARAAADKYGTPETRVVTDYKALLNDPALDLVSICTPSGAHAAIAIDCAKAGKSCLSEKPLDVTTAKLDAVEAAFKGIKAKCACVFQYRTYPGVREAKRLLDEGALGRILLSNGYSKVYRSPQYFLDAGWRGTWELDGGGATMNQGIHIVDITTYFGGGCASVLGKFDTLARDIQTEDVSYAIYRLKSGAMGSYTATTLYNPNLGVKVETVCEDGMITFDGSVTKLIRPDKEEIVLGQTIGGESFGSNKIAQSPGHAWLVRDLANAVAEDRDPFVPVSKGRHAVDIILATYQSSRENREIIL